MTAEPSGAKGASIADVEFELAAIIKGGDALKAYDKGFVGKCSLLHRDDIFEVGEKLKKALRDFKVGEWKGRIKSEKEKLEASKPKTNGHAADWTSMLLRTNNGAVQPLVANAITALRSAPEWEGVLAFNELTQCAVAIKEPPFATTQGAWSDANDTLTANWIQHQGVPVGKSTVADAIQAVAHDRPFHPVRQYLKSLKWDGEPRINRWLENYMGVAWDEFTGPAGSKWLISAVARAMDPGCQVDTCLVLEGEQGIYKSSVLRALATDEWFTDQLADPTDIKESSQDLAGKWIVEISELDKYSRHEQGVIKSFIPRRVDHYRPSYGRHSADFDRQCVFAATTNKVEYLGDETGGRRWWPVNCKGDIDLGAVVRDRDQLWAEAVAKYQDGVKWYFEKGTDRVAKEAQKERRVYDVWDEMVWAWVKQQEASWPSPDEEKLSYQEKREPEPFYISTDEILLGCLKKKPEAWTLGDRMRIGAILQSHEMQRRQKRIEGDVRVWRYYIPTAT